MGIFDRFRTDQSGATAMVFGLAALPVVVAAGAALDYSRAASETTRLQRATDALALALVREPASSSAASLEAQADKLLTSLYPAAAGIVVQAPRVVRTGSRVSVEVSGTVKAAFMPLLGFDRLPVGAAGSAVLTRAEIALVLDNTGSMADWISGGRKIDALQGAAKKLLADLRAVAGQPETVKVSLVPFDTEVRLDPDLYRYKPWFRWKNSATDRAAWTGYVYDRYGTAALSDESPDERSRDTLFPAPVETEYKTDATLRRLATAGGTLTAIQPLTSLYAKADFDRLNDAIGSMKPRGYTNVALGTMWGLATLSRSEPFAEAAPAGDTTVRKYMVVLTDGENNLYHRNGALTADEGQVDRNTAAACALAKEAGIEVFAIRLEKGDEKLLSGCASSKDDYFNVQSTAQLDAAFKRIVDSITGARLTN